MDLGNTLFGTTNSVYKDVGGIGTVASTVFNIAFVVAGLVLLFFFILGGIGMISSAGQSDSQKAEKSKKTLTSAVIGFVIVFASYWIVKLIGQIVGMPNLI